MRMVKSYLGYIPNKQEIDFFGWKKDEKGYYHEEMVYESEEEKRAANDAQLAEYWKQFSKEEIEAMTF